MDFLAQQCRHSFCWDIKWSRSHVLVDEKPSGTKQGIFKLQNSSCLFQVYVTGTNSPCTAGQLLPGGKHLICVYANGNILLWDLKDSTNSSVSLRSPCTALDLHPSLPLAVVGTEEGVSTLINTTNMSIVSQFGKANEVNWISMLLIFLI